MDKILYMCMSGTVLIAAVMCFRYLFYRQVSKRFIVVLWIFAMLRLLLPISIPVRWPAVSGLHSVSGSVWRCSNLNGSNLNGSDLNGSDPNGFDMLHKTGTASADLDEADKEAWNARMADARFKNFAFAVWLAAALFLALKIIIRHMRSRKVYSLSLPVCEEKAAEWLRTHRCIRKVSLRQSEFVKGPFTYGIFRPVIMMPSQIALSEEEFQCIMEHEWAHIRWWDVLIKHILYLVVCLYWFHPLVWIMAVLLNRDMEVACDEEIVRKYSCGLKATYARILIRLAENRQDSVGPAGACFTGVSEIEERIEMIMKTKKYSRKAVVLAAGMLCCVATAFTVSAKEVPEKADVAAESINQEDAERKEQPADGAISEQEEQLADGAISEQEEQPADGAISEQEEQPATDRSAQEKLSAEGRGQIVQKAEGYIGTAYQFGGTDLLSGVDSPGFVKAVYGEAGIELPQNLSEQAVCGAVVPLEKLEAGDLVFYGEKEESGFEQVVHVGIYDGRGQVIHASNMRDGVKKSDLYYREIVSAVRILE